VGYESAVLRRRFSMVKNGDTTVAAGIYVTVLQILSVKKRLFTSW
jgi:hypothetical protein